MGCAFDVDALAPEIYHVVLKGCNKFIILCNKFFCHYDKCSIPRQLSLYSNKLTKSRAGRQVKCKLKKMEISLIIVAN